MYVVLFLPLFFSAIRVGNFSGKIPSLTVVWWGIFLYLLISFAVIAALRNELVSFNAALIIQAIAVFLLAVSVYMGYFANSHVQGVAREEAALRQYLSEIKTKAALLALPVNALPAEYEKIQKILRQAADDIKYISPVQNNAGTDIETRIISSLDGVKSLCESVAEGGRPASFEADAEKLLRLVKERKLLRN
jgi:hypothetical protein